LIGSMDVIWYDFGTEVWQIMADFCHPDHSSDPA
jgi:hypothetical protein